LLGSERTWNGCEPWVRIKEELKKLFKKSSGEKTFFKKTTHRPNTIHVCESGQLQGESVNRAALKCSNAQGYIFHTNNIYVGITDYKDTHFYRVKK